MMIAFIGLGIMGSNMAANLIRGGNKLIVYNRTPGKDEQLLSMGAVHASSPSEAAKNCDILFTMLASPNAVKDTALGLNGFLNSLKENTIWIDCSTVNPSFTREMKSICDNKKIRFIDAPVSGTRSPAQNGELLFFAGGDTKDIEEVTPFLNLMGKKIIYAGPHGMGTSFKMVVNIMLGVSMEIFLEALVLGEAMGLTKEKLLEVLPGAPVSAPFLSGKKDKLLGNSYDPDFPLYLMYKDLQLAAVTGYEKKVSLPVTNAVKEVYALASEKGFDGDDFSAIYKFLRK